MKRIPLAVAVLTALLPAAIVAAPATAKKAPSKKPISTTLVTKVTCKLKLATAIPSHDVTVTQGAESGTQYGRANCGKPLFTGVEQDTFAQDDAGNLTGKYQQWFNTGSVFGTYTLTPADSGPPTTTSFTQASYTGTITVTNGTGTFKKATGTGTLACFTPDLAHYTCTEKLKLVQSVAPTSSKKSKKS